MDARLYQILFLGTLLALGIFWRDFSIHPSQIALTFFFGILTQTVCLKLIGRKETRSLPAPYSSPSNYFSCLITCLGTSLLLRADNFWVHPLAISAAISSKFISRASGKHLFNPANFGVMLALIFLPGAWVSSGQWGHEVVITGWVLLLGSWVVNRALRTDVAWMFLASYLGFVALRVFYLGQSWNIWFHQFSNGALLLFSFFMISDPKTIPNHPTMRILFACLVAMFAFFWHYGLYKTNGLLWALFLLSPLVPFLDQLKKAAIYDWALTLQRRRA